MARAKVAWLKQLANDHDDPEIWLSAAKGTGNLINLLCLAKRLPAAVEELAWLRQLAAIETKQN